MSDPTPAPVPLTAEEAARLTDFARAFKAAARAVVLYPLGHPAIGATLGRIAHITSAAALPEAMRLSVLPDGMLLNDRAPARPDASIAELSGILHGHLIGQMVVHGGGDGDAWRAFLLLIARTPESVRADGGIARVWMTMAHRHVELVEIDYAEVLRERTGGDSATWERLIALCAHGDVADLDDAGLRDLLAIAGQSDRLADLMAGVDAGVDAGGGIGAKSAAVMRLLRGIVALVGDREPDQLEPVLRNMATAVGQLTPEMLLGLLAQREDDGPGVVQAVVSRMTDGTIAHFVARQVIADTSTDRLAQVFQTLVQDSDRQQRLLALAHDDVAASPLGSTEGFEAAWNHVAQNLITSYSDSPFVSTEYARELSAARTQAMEVERVSDDPPERVSAWLSTIATSELRSLDLTLLLDLLRIEDDEGRWGQMMTPVVGLLDDLLLVGDFDSALALIHNLAREASGDGSAARRQHAMTAIDLLIAGSMMRHIAAHLATIDDAQFERVKAMCVSLGTVVVRPLAEALSAEERPRTQERLTAILIAFGAVAQRTIERLKSSPNPAVRRTAIVLMRRFGGSDALPDLTELLDDSEPQVQREAVRAILNVGTDAAYRVLEQALAGGTERSREAIMQSIGMIRDERATPIFAYILRRTDHRGPLMPIYLRAIESLGALRDPTGVGPLKEALYRGEWWAPRRTGMLRAAVATALARIGAPEALAVLEEAAGSRSRGVRAAARAPLAAARAHGPTGSGGKA